MIVEDGGLLTTVQDEGRFHWQRYGVMVSGAMDQEAMRLANLLVGNPPGEAVLEATVLGPSLRFTEDEVIAITGADMSPLLDGHAVPMYMALPVRRGQVLALGTAQGGVRTYIAFAGGLDIPPVMGSRSTLLRAELGGFQGRKLRAGDVLPLAAPAGWLDRWSRRVLPPRAATPEEVTIRVIPGPQEDRFQPESLETFLSAAYRVRPESDRMGYRLEGPPLVHSGGANIITDGIAFGSVQVPSDGMPIVMMADRQCTGGYTKIANVITVDLPQLAQCGPGIRLRFRAVTVEEAQTLLVRQRVREERLDRSMNGRRTRFPPNPRERRRST